MRPNRYRFVPTLYAIWSAVDGDFLRECISAHGIGELGIITFDDVKAAKDCACRAAGAYDYRNVVQHGWFQVVRVDSGRVIHE